jgi:ABC-type branched-subunit amino acid transport system ATPase component
LSVLIGPNGSGKTNILQALMFLNKLAYDDRFGRSPKGRISVSSRIRAKFDDPNTQVRLNATINASPDESNNDVMFASRQKWWLKSPERKLSNLEFPLFMGSGPGGIPLELFYARNLPGYRRLQGMLTGHPKTTQWALDTLVRVNQYCSGIRYYSASQFTNPGSCPASFEIEQEGGRRALLRQRGHTRILYSMYSAQRATPNDRYLRFFEIVGPKGLRLLDDLTFHEVRTSSIDYSVRVGGKVEIRRRKRNKLLVIPRFKIGTQVLSPNQLSEGTFKTLALLFHIMTEPSTALLIEEPEVCVHHGLLSSILEVIKSFSHKKQIIISTHSDYVLDQVKPENVYQVMFDKTKGTVVSHIPESMTRKELSALRTYLDREGNLGEYWREGGLGDRP